MRDLETVLKTLKPNKARNQEGIDRTIFGTNIIGTNLRHYILKLFNAKKKSHIIQTFMKKAKVTAIPKKGSKVLLTKKLFLLSTV